MEDAVATNEHASSGLGKLLLGERFASITLPALEELMTAVLALAGGRRRKVLLPYGSSPRELALVRRGSYVLCSCYETGSIPEVIVLNRSVELRTLLEVGAQALEQANGELSARLGERARRARIATDPFVEAPPCKRRGGAIRQPASDVPVAFGYSATIYPSPMWVPDESARADVHSLLFSGRLWVWLHGRRVPLVQGPIMLAVQRMVHAVRALLDGCESRRPTSVRLCAGSFHVSVRWSPKGLASLSLGGGSESVSAPSLEVPLIALPILRLASDVLRALVSADRSQGRNLRVRELRTDVRQLRRRVRGRSSNRGFVNTDPDRLRVGDTGRKSSVPPPAQPPRRLRFSERWRLDVEELDAATTYLCGDRLVVATAGRSVAISRNEGEPLWMREGRSRASFMLGTVLVRQLMGDTVELIDIGTGDPYAEARIDAGSEAVGLGLYGGGGSLPPVAILREAPHRVVAVDLRNGELRWRFSAAAGAVMRVRRAGRVLLATSGGGSVDALDIASGEVVWRVSEPTRFSHEAIVCRDVAIAAERSRSSACGGLFGIELYTGRVLWHRELPGPPAVAPVAAGARGAVVLCGSSPGSLALVDANSGDLQWTSSDFGWGGGGAPLCVDDLLIVNAPTGQISAVGLEDGVCRWTQMLADPVADDVPRSLEPILRGGALFVPTASVHVLRPTDGTPIGTSLPCDLIPDLLRVDERGWIYVAEESGVMAAFAPLPQLSLVHSR